MTDRQLPLEPTTRIDPSTQVSLMPGIDAVCMCGRGHDCRWPFDPGCWNNHNDPKEAA